MRSTPTATPISSWVSSCSISKRRWTTISNTAGALGALFTLIRDANIAIDAGRITSGDAEGLKTALMRIDPILDIFPKRDDALDSSVEKLIDARNAARRTRNFSESDRIRDELLGKGIILEDTPGGTRWRRKG